MPKALSFSAAVFAAGAASRMHGYPKPFICRAGLFLVEAQILTLIELESKKAVGLGQVLVVVSDRRKPDFQFLFQHSRQPLIKKWWLERRLLLVVPQHGESFSASLRAAFYKKQRSHDLLVTLCDQPGVSPAHLARLITPTFGVDGQRLAVFSNHENRLQAPAFIPADWHRFLEEVKGDRGFGALRETLKLPCHKVRAKPQELRDLDTLEDLRLWWCGK